MEAGLEIKYYSKRLNIAIIGNKKKDKYKKVKLEIRNLKIIDLRGKNETIIFNKKMKKPKIRTLVQNHKEILRVFLIEWQS
jgi:hypothetical protein